MLEDDDLIRRIAAGDEEAFSVLYRRHVSSVVAYLRRRVAEPELAFDLAAETFAQVVTGAASYRGEGPVIGWILGIARHKLADSERRGRVEDEARRRLAAEPVLLTDHDLERVEERAVAGQASLEVALAGLPKEMRQALMARIVDDRDYKGIALELGCSEQVVRQRVHRGLARLRAALEQT